MQHAVQPATAGVGITFRQLATVGFVVVKVASGGPSDRRGVEPGDILTRVDRQEVRAPCAACQALATQRVDHIAAPASSTAGSVSASEPRAHCPPLRIQVSQLSFENVARRLVGLIGSSVSLTFLRRSPVSCGVAGAPLLRAFTLVAARLLNAYSLENAVL